MTGRPGRDVMRAALFDDRWHPTGDAKRGARRVFCNAKEHTVGWAQPTPVGWFVVWRTGKTTWEYDWADEVVGYTEATCTCGRRKRVDDVFARLPAIV